MTDLCSCEILVETAFRFTVFSFMTEFTANGLAMCGVFEKHAFGINNLQLRCSFAFLVDIWVFFCLG